MVLGITADLAQLYQKCGNCNENSVGVCECVVQCCSSLTINYLQGFAVVKVSGCCFIRRSLVHDWTFLEEVVGTGAWTHFSTSFATDTTQTPDISESSLSLAFFNAGACPGWPLLPRNWTGLEFVGSALTKLVLARFSSVHFVHISNIWREEWKVH